MTAAEFFASLSSRGVSARLDGGKVVLSPLSKVTASDKRWMKSNKTAAVEWLSSSDDAVTDAIIARAWDDDPFAGNDGPHAALRESLIVRLPNLPAVAMDPAAYEELAAWNRQVLARQPGGKPADRRKTKPAGGIFGASGSEAD